MHIARDQAHVTNLPEKSILSMLGVYVDQLIAEPNNSLTNSVKCVVESPNSFVTPQRLRANNPFVTPPNNHASLPKPDFPKKARRRLLIENEYNTPLRAKGTDRFLSTPKDQGAKMQVSLADFKLGFIRSKDVGEIQGVGLVSKQHLAKLKIN